MRTTRLYLPQALTQGAGIRLTGERARYLATVLRLDAGATLIVFNGRGGEFEARLSRVRGGAVEVEIGAFRDVERESPLAVTLVQGVCRGERMDFTIQKAVELGVNAIVPVMTERSVVRLEGRRRASRLAHWRAVAVNACQQCGRTRVPELEDVPTLADWLGDNPVAPAAPGFVLDPAAALTPAGLDGAPGEASLLVGPEGGLTEAEHALAARRGFRGLALGPRTLRSETAAVAALAALQLKWGDLSTRR